MQPGTLRKYTTIAYPWVEPNGPGEFLICEPGDFVMFLGITDTSQKTYKPLYRFWHLRYRTAVWIQEHWIHTDTAPVIEIV